MDINSTAKPEYVKNNGDQNVSAETEKQQLEPAIEMESSINQEDVNDIIKRYLLDGVMEKTYFGPNKISVRLRAPSQKQMMQASIKIDEDSGVGEYISADRMQLIKNIALLSVYVAAYNDKDFAAEQGDSYDTPESFKARNEYLTGAKGPNIYASDWIIERMNEFQKLAGKCFEFEPVKNS